MDWKRSVWIAWKIKISRIRSRNRRSDRSLSARNWGWTIDQLSDRSNFAVDRFYDSVHCTSIAKMAFSWVPDWSFFKLVTAKRPLELPFRLVISGRFAFNELKNDRSKIEKNVGLAIALGWAMSLKGLTANLDRSFEWFISPRKRPIVRAVAQLTREIFTILTLRT